MAQTVRAAVLVKPKTIPRSVLKKMDLRIPAGVAVMFNPLAAGLSWAGSIPAAGPGDRVVILGAGQRGELLRHSGTGRRRPPDRGHRPRPRRAQARPRP